MALQRHVPNIITLGNLLCGCVALVFATSGQYYYTFFFVALGIFLDFFDGFFARLLKVSSPLGLQLDSLADMVTSGVVPGYIMYRLLLDAEGVAPWMAFFGFAITLGSCYRLANFNVDTRQTDSFIGLPTPANALFILSLPLIKDTGSLLALEALINPVVLGLLTCLSVYMLNAEIPLFALKFKDYSIGKNKLRYAFLAISVLLLLMFGYSGIPLVIVSYVLLSVFVNRRAKKLQ